MVAYIHCCNRMLVEQFLCQVTEEVHIQALHQLSRSPGTTFAPSGGKGQFRIWNVEECPDGLHFVAVRAVELH